jgi:type IV secretory pathway TraG/TraD family ATPase VirD4
MDELVSGPKKPIHFTTALVTIELIYLIPVAIGLYFMKKKGGGGGKAHVRGATVISSDQLSAQLKNNVSEECLPITSAVKIPKQIETTHFFICGRPGSGKSQLFYRIVPKVFDRGEKGIYYDFKGDMVAKFFDKNKHILFNPFDQRCISWNVFNEIETPLDIRSIAASMIPITGNDPYWSTAARDVFAGILTGLYHAGEKNNDAVYRWCNLPCETLHRTLSKYPGTETATKHLASEKQGMSVLSVMAGSVSCFEYLRNIDGVFSIKKWASDDSDKRSVFLSNYSEISDTIRPILSLFIEITGKQILSLPDNRDRRIFFFIDEFGTLANMPTIPTMLTNGRSKGMSIWIAIQDIGQIEKLYGREIAQTIINSCASSFTFAVNDPNTADFLSRKIGEREIKETNVSHTDGQSSSSTTSQQTRQERAVLPSEILGMPNLCTLTKLSGYTLAIVNLEIVSLPDVQPAFEKRSDLSLAAQAAYTPAVEPSTPTATKAIDPYKDEIIL